ncbi:UNVERIFIED_ORG: hypothetical protein B2H98_06455 [Clostridium botulinum]|uniref:hypothetical protein n=1 Tax=unclassified Clostridium TaxID=2614128 RepID=UPI000A171EB2|nr:MULTISPECIES: hypothetical protein [unclassified Clostridium]NFG61469.1 hypothetical protein [Clostridium botulinum]NFQ10451.1 hypothetical protein [Clostridium botulinum]NFS29611.1 hypothetical protein [Clostridium botulinum]NFS54605.1 hypothetical protein [Clostridium botulinum]NFT17767.1 hypothetical protein [Clostridium botulinum]
MKKIFIAISIILIILLMGVCHNSTKVKLFENVDTESIDTITILYFGGSFSTEDKNDILEIMNYLKGVQFSERSNRNAPNTTPDVIIGLSDNNQNNILHLEVYGDLARVTPEQEIDYTIPDGFYKEIDNMSKKYRENNK